MEKSCGKVRDCLRFDPRNFAVFLRRLYPAETAARVADDIGVGKRTVEGWLAQETRPTADAFVRMVGAYGIGALCAAMNEAPDWADRARRAEEQAGLRRRIDELQARLSAGA